MHRKIKPKWKICKTIITKIKGSTPSKNRKKNPKTPKEPSSVENIKAKLQASIEKGDFFPQWKPSSLIMVKNCFWMTDQEATQGLGHGWKSF